MHEQKIKRWRACFLNYTLLPYTYLRKLGHHNITKTMAMSQVNRDNNLL